MRVDMGPGCFVVLEHNGDTGMPYLGMCCNEYDLTHLESSDLYDLVIAYMRQYNEWETKQVVFNSMRGNTDK